MNEHNVALKAYLEQERKKVAELQERVKKLEEWKEKQPLYTMIDGKWQIVPSCFD